MARDGGDLLVALSYLLLTPFLLAYLGVAQYGMFAIVGALIGWLGLLELAVKPNLARGMAAAEAAGDQGRLNVLLSSTIALLAGLGAVAMPVG